MNLMESLLANKLAAKQSSGGSNLTPEVKEALLDCFSNVAWATEDGQQYYDALADALYGLQSISAVYTQSGHVYDTDSLDSLKDDLVVTALYGDGSTQTVPAESYTLSGTLTEGTSTITVSYGGKTATFTATVKHNYADSLENWLRSTSGTTGYADGALSLKCNTQTEMSSYYVYCADRAKTLWNEVEGKTLKFRLKVKGNPAFVDGTDRLTFAVGIFADSTISSLGAAYRLKWASLSASPIVPTSEYQWYEATFTATIGNLTGGTGTPTNVSTFGIHCYEVSLKTAYISDVQVYEVDAE